MVGNMISDFVKGASRLGFNGNIGRGIILHRNIDEYTDSHPATKKAREIFRPHYRLYSGAIMDILYDYFLANDDSEFTNESLASFTQGIYSSLEEHAAELPPRFLHAFTYMKNEDWLYNYRFTHGIQKSLQGLVRRAAYLSDHQTAFDLFLEHHDELNLYYREFFPDVKQFANQRMTQLVL